MRKTRVRGLGFSISAKEENTSDPVRVKILFWADYEFVFLQKL
jgi:hypothetical protein